MIHFCNQSQFTPQLMAADKDGVGYPGSYPDQPRITFNPLRVEVGGALQILDPELSQFTFTARQLANTTVEYDGERYVIADYSLETEGDGMAPHLADEDGKIRVRLRCVSDGHGSYDSVAFQAQWLTQGAGEEFRRLTAGRQASLPDAEGNFARGFSRIDGVEDIYRGARTAIGDPASPDPDHVSLNTYQIEYADYERWHTPPEGEGYTQWALVEFNPATQDMMTLFGWSIDSNAIRVI